ncbi:hypothetical protein C5L38_35030 (plasmid) [Streptomyces sp. WAC00288]|nr:hypothetical protein C5L38_35030 [Streptomyces sp. WAC00288]
MPRGRFAYEQQLVGTDGQSRFPDFTITTDDPARPIIWEHWACSVIPTMPRNGRRKKAWYAEQGILEGDGGPRGPLLITDDRGGVKEDEWEATFLKAFAASASIRPRFYRQAA